jgi:hypothetical protein
MRRSLCALAVSAAGFAATAAPAQGDQPAPHVGFYAIHPRVGLSTYFALSDSWPNTTKPLQIVAKIHSPGQPCAATPTTDTGRIFATARLRKSPSDTVWQDWTPTTSGSYVVCTWLGDPVIATKAVPLVIEPKAAGVTPAGSIFAASTSTTPTGRPRAHFETPPDRVYARFALRGVKPGRRVTIEFRDTDHKVVLFRFRSKGPELTWYRASVSQARIAKRLGYWIASVRVGPSTLGRIHFLVPNR